MIKILVVDDDPHVRELVRFHLHKNGYEVLEADDGVNASLLLQNGTIDLAIVDVMMPHKNGWELCYEIREVYDIPILMLTARGELKDKEKAFHLGTDDYMVKPFEIEELTLRVKALLRRYEVGSTDSIQMGNTIINRESYDIIQNGTKAQIPLKEFELLTLLAGQPNRTFTREQLINIIWGAEYEGDSRTVDVHIKRLRERFKNNSDFVIHTVRGLGYKLEVTE